MLVDICGATNHLEMVAAMVVEVRVAVLAPLKVVLKQMPRHLDVTTSGGCNLWVLSD